MTSVQEAESYTHCMEVMTGAVAVVVVVFVAFVTIFAVLVVSVVVLTAFTLTGVEMVISL